MPYDHGSEIECKDDAMLARYREAREKAASRHARRHRIEAHQYVSSGRSGNRLEATYTLSVTLRWDSVR